MNVQILINRKSIQTDFQFEQSTYTPTRLEQFHNKTG